MECSDTTALSSYVLVNDTLLVNESSPTEENGALYQSSAGNTNQSANFDTKTALRFGGLFLRLCPEAVYSCGFRAFSVFVAGGLAVLFSHQRHSRSPKILERFRFCPPYID